MIILEEDVLEKGAGMDLFIVQQSVDTLSREMWEMSDSYIKDCCYHLQATLLKLRGGFRPHSSPYFEVDRLNRQLVKMRLYADRLHK